jgi:hypothetical protein
MSGEYDGTDDYEAVAARDERRARARRAALRVERTEREAARRADDAEAALRRTVARLKRGGL